MLRRIFAGAALMSLALSGTLVSAAGASAASPAPAWNGPGAWAALPRLKDYTFKAFVLEGYDLGAILYDQEEIHSGGDYRVDLLRKAASFADDGATTLVHAGGRYYVQVTWLQKNSPLKVGWYSLGAAPTGTYADIVHQFGMLDTAWQTRLTGSMGTYAGACRDAGRAGYGYRVRYPNPAREGGRWIAGTACIDRVTGAPLRLALTLHRKGSMGGVDIVDRFTVQEVGRASVAAPASAKPTGP